MQATATAEDDLKEGGDTLPNVDDKWAVSTPPSADEDGALPPSVMMQYEYRTYEDAPARHREIMRYAFFECGDKDIAAFMFLDLRQVRKVLSHTPNYIYLQSRLAQKRVDTFELIHNATDGRGMAVKRMVAMLADDEKDLSVNDVHKLGTFFADRHPDGRLVKQQKTEINNNHNIFAGAQISRLKQRFIEVQAQGEVAPMVEATEVKVLADDSKKEN